MSQTSEAIVGRPWFPRDTTHGKKATAMCAHFCPEAKGVDQGHSQRAPK